MRRDVQDSFADGPRWSVSEQLLPGPSVVTTTSRFAGLAGAASLTLVAQATAGGAVPTRRASVSLDGLWDRAVEPALANSTRRAYSPAPGDLAWGPSVVPQNFGTEPDLAMYFGPVWYRRHLRRPSGAEFVDLHFDAVDYLADVVIDGEHVASHEGSFAPWVIDLSETLTQDSELVVRVQDPLDELKPGTVLPFSYRSSIKGVLNFHDSRRHFDVTGEAPQMQAHPTGGIVGSTSLSCTGPVRLDAVFLTPLDLEGALHLCVAVTNRTARSRRVVLRVDIKRPDGRALPGTNLSVDVPPGAARLDVTGEIPQPVLWWDAGFAELGAPALYAATVSVLVDDAISDARTETFGLRVARFPSEPLFHYELNGRSTHLRAVNYIPVEHWAGLGADFYERDFTLMKRGHIHSVGVHAHVQSPHCYDAADRLGISVFQDFPLQWNYTSGPDFDPTFLPTALGMAADMAYLLWNHPSVVYWSGHNEPTHYILGSALARMPRADGAEPFTVEDVLAGRVEAPFVISLDDFGPERDLGNYHLDTAIAAVLRTVDPLRYVHRDSGQGIDMHDYTGTLSGGSVFDAGGAYTAPFVSEFGDFFLDSTILKTTSETQQNWPPSEDQLAELCRGGIVSVTSKMVGPVTGFPNLASFAYASERRAAFSAKFLTEYYRSHPERYTAHRWHFFVNHWGHAGAGLVDVDRVPTAAYHAYAAANRPRMACALPSTAVFEPGLVRVPVHVVNGSPFPWEPELSWELTQLPALELIRSGAPAATASGVTPLAAYLAPQDGTYVLGLPDPGPRVTDGSFDTPSLEPGSALLVGEVAVTTETPGGYRLTLTWDDSETNTFDFLVAPAGWRAEHGYQVLRWSV